MFAIERDEALESSRWRAGKCVFIEAWKYLESKSPHDPIILSGELEDAEIPAWLAGAGRFKVRVTPPNCPKLALKLLLTFRTELNDRILDFTMTKESFLAVERAFKLPPCTLPAFYCHPGIYTDRVDYQKENPDIPDKFSCVFRACQHTEVSNYGLSITHSFADKTTVGVLHYTRVQVPKLGQQLSELTALIKSNVALWSHPLFIPLAVMDNLVHRSLRYTVLVLDDEVLRLERELSSTKLLTEESLKELDDSKVLDYRIPTAEPAKTEKVHINAQETMVELTTYLNSLKFVTRTHEWQRDCLGFLSSVLVAIAPILADQECRQHHEVEVMIRYLQSKCANTLNMTRVLRERLDTQFLLYHGHLNTVDSRFGARLAAAASRDSVSMKTLAFISVLFLPPTFIATLFSMNIFHVVGDTGSDESNQYFWLFWAVAVPFTCLVISAWMAWSHLEQSKRDWEQRVMVKEVEMLSLSRPRS